MRLKVRQARSVPVGLQEKAARLLATLSEEEKTTLAGILASGGGYAVRDFVEERGFPRGTAKALTVEEET